MGKRLTDELRGMASRMLLLALLDACLGLRLVKVEPGRREVVSAMSGAMSTALLLPVPSTRSRWIVPASAAEDDDELEDEIPDPGRPMPKKSKPGAAGSASFNKNLTPADGKNAAVQILAARTKLDAADKLVSAGDWKALKSLMDSAPVSSFEENALVLVQSKALSPDDVKAIGTIKRYGVGADVIIMLGGLSAAAGNADAGNAKSYLAKAKASLDEILVICKGNRLV